MKINVKTLKGTHFEIEVKPQDTVADVKKNIETVQGSDVYPASQQMLIHKGKVLKDETTLEQSEVAENSFVVIMLTKNKSSTAEGSAPSTASTNKAPESSAPPPAESAARSTPQTTSLPASATAVAPVPAVTSSPDSNVYGQAASNLVAGSNLEQSIQQILEMGGGTWDRDMVVRALRAAFNNPERAVDYLYSGIPETAEAPAPPPALSPALAGVLPGGQAADPSGPTQQPPQPPASVPSSGPNVNPLDLFPQGLPNLGAGPGSANTLDFLRNSPQFQALRAMVQANPQILQPMLQELGKKNPNLTRLIQEHQADFLRLINEPVEGGEGNILEQLAGAGAGAVPASQAVTVTPEELEAIQRLEALGFDRQTVLEVYFACNKNEDLAANYLLDHSHEFDQEEGN